MQGLILAAGQGKRFAGGNVKALLKVKEKSLIAGLIEKFQRFGIDRIKVVTGYQSKVIEKEINIPGVEFIHNPFFNYSENLLSFWVGAKLIEDECLFAHCDLIFQDDLLGKVMASTGDFVLPYDRTSMNNEAMKIRTRNGEIVELSKSIPEKEALGESIPLMKFSHKAMKSLKLKVEEIIESGVMNQYLENTLIKVIRKRDLSCDLVDVSGCKWMEIDTPEDFYSTEELFEKEPEDDDLNSIEREAADNWEEYWNSELKPRKIFKSRLQESLTEFAKRSGSSRLLYDIVSNELDDNDNTILEAGCGRAEAALKLAEEGKIVFLVDTSMSALEHIGQYLESESVKAFPIRASIFQLPFKDEAFDFVFNSGVIDHFKTEGRKAATEEMMRVTGKTGKSLIAVSDSHSIIHDRAMDFAIKEKRWGFGFKQSFYTLRDLLEDDEREIAFREYSRGFTSQFEFLHHFIPAIEKYQKLFFRLFYILSCPFKFLNRFPGQLLVTVIEKGKKRTDSEPINDAPPIHDNSIYRKRVIRPLAKKISPFLHEWSFSAFGISWVKLVVGLAGAGILASKSALLCLGGMLLLQLNFFLDAVDGEVARLQGEAGKLSGEYWDKLSDLLPKSLMYFLWGYGTFRLTGSHVPLFCGAFFSIWNIYPRYCGVETLLERIDKMPGIYAHDDFHSAVKKSFSITKNRGVSDFYLTILIHPAMNILTLFFLLEILLPEIKLTGNHIYTRYLFLLIFTFVGAINFLRKGVRFFRLLNFK